MSDTPETLAAVLAEMRGAAKSTDLFNGEEVGEPLIRGTKVEEWADRVEAAAERERDAHMNDIHDALYMATGIPGNAAAMREALMKAKLYFDHRGEGTNLDDAGMAIDAITSIDAALAAPARNCDRFADVFRASEAYEATKTDLPFEEWLFSTEKGKETDNG